MSGFGQGRVGVRALARPASDVLRFLLDLLVPELPAILDLRQQLPNPFDILFGPEMNCDAAGRNDFWRRYFLGRDVAAKCGGVQT
jgi:hypothetical protein